jgi:hypothetical protein
LIRKYFKDKSIIYILHEERKWLKASTWNDKYKETFIQLCNKRITHVHPITCLKEKPPNHTGQLSVVANHVKKVKCTYPYCWWIYIKLFTYICTQSPSKRIINKELHMVPLWKSMLNVFLSRWMCPTNTPRDCQNGS